VEQDVVAVVVVDLKVALLDVCINYKDKDKDNMAGLASLVLQKQTRLKDREWHNHSNNHSNNLEEECLILEVVEVVEISVILERVKGGEVIADAKIFLIYPIIFGLFDIFLLVLIIP